MRTMGEINVKKMTATLVLLALLTAIPCLAEDLIKSDIKGLSDHPLLKRFENSVLIGGEKKTFDESTIALGRVEFDYGAQSFKEWPKEKIEGARFTGFYRMPKDVTTLEALKNYENDLKEKGFETRFSGSGEELDNGYGRFVAQVYGKQDNHLMQYILPAAKDYRYLTMQKSAADGSRVVFSGFFAKVTDGWRSKYGEVGDTLARIDLIETKPLTQRMTTVKAEEMAQQIDAGGKVALYGILFDFNKADIKPESEAALVEIAKYLGNNPSVKVLVVGHTDNVGAFEFNRELSEKRAKAVVDYLASRHNVSRERLFPFGASFAAPVSTNLTEEGKAKNRRVELVRF